MSIICVYLLTSDCPTDQYKEYLTELENAISTVQLDGLVVVMEDFNAHLGHPGENTHGQLVIYLCCLSNLYPVSLSQIASGPMYTSEG